VATHPRTRLAPAARREDILKTACRLFAERGYEAVSASEVAREAGVTLGLLDHYFGSKRGLFVALVERVGPRILEVIRVDAAKPVHVRTRSSANSWLDWVDVNREIWLATAGLDDNLADPETRAAVEELRERAIDCLIADYPATLSDEPEIRLMLRSFLAFNRVALRGWLDGEVSRAEAERLLAHTLHALITSVAPKLSGPTAAGSRRARSRSVQRAGGE
jgi:AcrR family transcriptional regulator